MPCGPEVRAREAYVLGRIQTPPPPPPPSTALSPLFDNLPCFSSTLRIIFCWGGHAQLFLFDLERECRRWMHCTCALKALLSNVAGSLPIAPSTSNPLVHFKSLPSFTSLCSQGKLKLSPTTTISLEILKSLQKSSPCLIYSKVCILWVDTPDLVMFSHVGRCQTVSCFGMPQNCPMPQASDYDRLVIDRESVASIVAISFV